MSTEDLDRAIEELRVFTTDHQHVEAKRAHRELPRRLWETLSAFANTPGGGLIILGLDEDDGFAAVGVLDARKVQGDLASMCADMQPRLSPRIETVRFEGKTLVTCAVPELSSSEKPCYYVPAGLKNGAFLRVGDGDRKLSEYEVHLLFASRGQPREDETPVLEATLEDLDPELVGALLARKREPEGSAFRKLDDAGALLTLKAAARVESGIHPTLGGLLALGKYPQQFYPALGATFVAYPTPRVGESGPGGERFLDNRRVDGPVPRMIGPLLDALRRNMKRRAIVHEGFRQDLWEYPETALREALVNALVHRDLSGPGRSSPVQVQMFPDRLAVVNPGGLHGPVSLERLGEEGVSSARNQVLMRLLEDVATPGDRFAVCENRGSGIGAMVAALRQSGMTPPVFEDGVSTFRVTFPNQTLLDDATVAWLSTIPGQLTDSQRMGLAMMKHGQVLTNAKYRQLLGLDSRLATRELSDLVSRRIILQKGTRRWATYEFKPVLHAPPRQRKDRRDDIVRVLRERGDLAAGELAAALALGSEAVRRWLRILRKEGRVTTTTSSPRSPNTKYRVASGKRPPTSK
ncbi:MAG: ATP-binding protein [Anaeromyxobacter sp.]